jgi:15-cis-phytoene synthase
MPGIPSPSRETLDAYAYCRAIIRHASKTFFWGSQLLPPAKRMAAWAVYAFCRTVDDCVDEQPDPACAEAQLDDLRDRLQRAYTGEANDPVMRAWVDMLRVFPIPIQPALDLIAGARMDLHHTQPESFADLHLYCYRVAGTVGLLMSPILGYRSAGALPCAVDLGIAMQLTNILRDIGEDLRNGRIYLPQNEMAAFGYCTDHLSHGVRSKHFIDLMRFQIDRANEYYRRARPGIALLDRGVQWAIATSAEMYRGILAAIVANDYDVFTRRASVPLRTKVALSARLWVASRRKG